MKITALAVISVFSLLLPSYDTKSLMRGFPAAVYTKDRGLGPLGDSSFSWKDCSTADAKSRMKIVNVNIDPNPIKRGQKIKLDLELSLEEEVTSGEVTVKLNYGAIPIVDENLDLCDLVTQVDRECPLKKGPFSINISEELPGYIPSGEYSGNATITDQNNKELVCLELSASVQ